MRILLVLVVCTVIVLSGCGKNSFETKPRLEVKSLSSDEIVAGGTLRVTLEYFDKEGDLSEGTLYFMRVRTNGTAIPDSNTNDRVDDDLLVLPKFPDKSQAEIRKDFDYQFLSEDPDRNDTMYFRFAVTDKEGNTSDTIATKLITAVE